MNVADVQRHLDNLVRLLDDAGAKVGKELAEFRTGLDPFADMSLKQFVDLLTTMAAFKRDGQLPASPKRAPAKTAAPKKTKPDSDALAAETKAFYERVMDPSITVADIDGLMGRLSELKGEGLRPVAAAVGVVVGKKVDTRKTLADIRRHIQERKGASQRAEHLHNPPSAANGASHSSAEPAGSTFEGG